MKRIFFLLVLLFSFNVLKAQPIKRWKMNDLLQYIEQSDSALIVNFWATFCGPCIEEIPYFQAIAKKYEGKKAKLLLVSLDFDENYPEKITAFAKKYGFTAEIVWLDESKPDEFCPKIDSSWSGAMPATLFVNTKLKYRYFVESKLNAERVEAEVINLTNYTCPESLPAYNGWVNDFEDIFTDTEEKELALKIERINQQKTAQIVLVTIEDYHPVESISLYAFYIGRCWRIGETETKNGIVILVSRNRKKIWISNGYGIERKMSDVETKEIIDQYIIPSFKGGQYYKGSIDAINAIEKKLKKDD